MLEVKNLIPAISIEGYEEDTDFRRGKGTYERVIKAMAILKAKKTDVRDILLLYQKKRRACCK